MGHLRADMMPVLRALVGMALLLFCPTQTWSDGLGPFPGHAITLIVPVPPGGVSQRLAETFAPALARTLGVPVLIRNISGESGAVGTRFVAASAPDGYTLLVAPSTLLLLDPSVLPDAGFVPQQDLDPLIMAIRSPTMLTVHHSVPATSVAELIAYMRDNSPLAFGASGRGSINDLVAGEFFKAASVKGRMAYYQGGGAVVPALRAGEIEASFQDPMLVAEAVTRGELRALAVTGTAPSPLLPNVPTFAELGLPQVDAYTWQSVVAPAGLPPSVRQVLEHGLRQALLDHAVMSRLELTGAEVVAAGGRQITRVLADERRRWREIMTSDGSLAPSR